MPTYINLIRDPIERKISEFNYKRFRRDRPHRIPPEQRFMVPVVHSIKIYIDFVKLLKDTHYRAQSMDES